MRFVFSCFVLWAAVCALGCGNQYGFAREYEPLGDEDDYIEQEERVTYEEVRRDPADYRSKMLGWFGVVTRIDVDPNNGHARAELSFRTLQPRNLCADETEGSCRVTVSDRSSGSFTAVMTLSPDDAGGQERVWNGSLVKVYGAPTGDFDDQGGPVLQARYYRHWPRGYYRTSAARSNMRR